ncbi:hypothetical protein GWI33_016966 [Rhynchophorus ferrugineus]|uniref:Uncharacterized protein n=1 Tax=Rhynchophorus ferrugineus TaxID=354439 RepID=A0A834M6N4_RHYFE|nr:hypothetical protein GWI33_016966 [Rhynchophorus ferrugineus]
MSAEQSSSVEMLSRTPLIIVRGCRFSGGQKLEEIVVRSGGKECYPFGLGLGGSKLYALESKDVNQFCVRVLIAQDNRRDTGFLELAGVDMRISLFCVGIS